MTDRRLPFPTPDFGEIGLQLAKLVPRQRVTMTQFLRRYAVRIGIGAILLVAFYGAIRLGGIVCFSQWRQGDSGDSELAVA